MTAKVTDLRRKHHKTVGITLLSASFVAEMVLLALKFGGA